MASSSLSSASSSRFPAFSVFKFASSSSSSSSSHSSSSPSRAPPPPPPKDGLYALPASSQLSLASPSFVSSSSAASTSTISRPPSRATQQTSSSSYAASSYATQHTSPHAQSSATLNTLNTYNTYTSLAPSDAAHPQPPSSASSTSSSFRRNLAKIASFGRRSRSRVSTAPSTSTTTLTLASSEYDDGGDDGISTPTNFAHHIHVDESFNGFPPSWTTALAAAGLTEADIAALKAARARSRSRAGSGSGSREDEGESGGSPVFMISPPSSAAAAAAGGPYGGAPSGAGTLRYAGTSSPLLNGSSTIATSGKTSPAPSTRTASTSTSASASASASALASASAPALASTGSTSTSASPRLPTTVYPRLRSSSLSSTSRKAAMAALAAGTDNAPPPVPALRSGADGTGHADASAEGEQERSRGVEDDTDAEFSLIARAEDSVVYDDVIEDEDGGGGGDMMRGFVRVDLRSGPSSSSQAGLNPEHARDRAPSSASARSAASASASAGTGTRPPPVVVRSFTAPVPGSTAIPTTGPLRARTPPAHVHAHTTASSVSSRAYTPTSANMRTTPTARTTPTTRTTPTSATARAYPPSSAASARSVPRTPPRRAPLRVVNGSPATPPPAYHLQQQQQGQGRRGDRVDNEGEGGENDEPPGMTDGDLARERPVEKSGARVDDDGVPAYDDGADQASDDERGAGAGGGGRPPQLVLPPRLSLRRDAIDDFASWSSALLSSLPSAGEPERTGDGDGGGGGGGGGGWLLGDAGAGLLSGTSAGLLGGSLNSASSASLGSAPNASLSSAPTRSPSNASSAPPSSASTPSVFSRPPPAPAAPLLPSIRLEADSSSQAQELDVPVEDEDITLSHSPLYAELMGMMQQQQPPQQQQQQRRPEPAGTVNSSHQHTSAGHQHQRTSAYHQRPSTANSSMTTDGDGEEAHWDDFPVPPAQGYFLTSPTHGFSPAPLTQEHFDGGARDVGEGGRSPNSDGFPRSPGESSFSHGTAFGSPAEIRFSREQRASQMTLRASQVTITDSNRLTLAIDSRWREDRASDASNASSSTVTSAAVVRHVSVVRRALASTVQSPQRIRRATDGTAWDAVHEEALESPVEITSTHRRAPSSSDDDDDSTSDSDSPSPGQTVSTSSGEGADGDQPPKPPPKPPKLVVNTIDPNDARRAVFSPTQNSGPESTAGFSSLAPSPAVTSPPTAPPAATTLLSPAPAASISTSSLSMPALSPPVSAVSSAFDIGSSPLPSPRLTGFSKSVKPLAAFVDASADPRARFADLVEIAQGESGSVFSARTVEPHVALSATSTSTSVALKIIPAAGNAAKFSSLRRELELVKDIRHPNVLRFEAAFVDLPGEAVWLGMELMERSLADILALRDAEGLDPADRKSVRMGERVIARFVWDVLLALSYLRKQHIAHRDVRSDNLLVNRDGVLKLADFGSAVRHPPGTPKLSENVGVLYWQAPEIRIGLYDPLKIDVWSLGATTWELAAGSPPFADIEDPYALGSAYKLPPLPEPEEDEEEVSRAFLDFLHLCAQPVANRAEPDELLNAHFVRTACPRSTIVQLLTRCKTAENKVLGRESDE